MTKSSKTKTKGVRISKIFRPIKIRTSRFGTLYLRHLTANSETQIARYKADGFVGRAMVVRILHSHLARPALSLDVVEQWSDRLLVRVGSIWIGALGYTIDRDISSEEAFNAFLDKYDLYTDELAQKLQAAHSQMFDSHRVAAKAMMADLSAIFGKPFNHDPLKNALDAFGAKSIAYDFGSQFKVPSLPFDAKQIAQLSAASHISQALEPVQALVDKLAPLQTLIDRLAPIQALSEKIAPIEAMADRLASVHSFSLRPAWMDIQLSNQMAELTQRFSGIDYRLDLRLPEMVLPSFSFDTDFFDRLWRRGEELDAGCLALAESAFAFLANFISVNALIQLGRLHRRVQPMILTKTMLAAATTDRFWEVMEIYFLSTPQLRGRWPAVRSALANHRRRDYHATIPVLLREIEGIFTDYLIAINQATIMNGKPYMTEASGAVKLNKNGDPVPFNGLDAKVKHHISRGFDDDDMGQLATRFLDYLAPQRNVILHGNLVDYAQPKLAAQLMWALFVIARTIALLFADHPTVPSTKFTRSDLERRTELYLVAL